MTGNQSDREESWCFPLQPWERLSSKGNHCLPIFVGEATCWKLGVNLPRNRIIKRFYRDLMEWLLISATRPKKGCPSPVLAFGMKEDTEMSLLFAERTCRPCWRLSVPAAPQARELPWVAEAGPKEGSRMLTWPAVS